MTTRRPRCCSLASFRFPSVAPIVPAGGIQARLLPGRRLSALMALLAASWVMAIAPSWAVAEEPMGFDRFPFGTTRGALLAEPGFRARCRPAPETQAGGRARGWRVTCPTYDLNPHGPMGVALLFSSEDRLVGYVMYIARDREKAVRTRIEALYGAPTSELEQGRTIAWLWPSGTEASLTVFCRGSDGCLTVKAKASEENAAPVKR